MSRVSHRSDAAGDAVEPRARTARGAGAAKPGSSEASEVFADRLVGGADVLGQGRNGEVGVAGQCGLEQVLVLTFKIPAVVGLDVAWPRRR